MKFKSQLFTLGLILSCFALFGQQNIKHTFQPNFKYRASLGRIDSSCIYKIYLTPNVFSKLETEYGDDFRLVDKNNNFVSFIFSPLIPMRPRLINLPLVSSAANTSSLAIFQNSENLVLDHFDLKIRNNSVVRNLNLSGSDDLQKWYAIADGEQVSRETYNDNGDGTFTHTVKFPSSNYKFFKVEQVDKKLKPISVLSGSIFLRPPPSKRYDTTSVKIISQKDSDDVSVVRIVLNKKISSNRLQLVFNGDKYYRRNIAIFENFAGEHKQIFNGYVSSDNKSPEVSFESESDVIELLVYNGDNKPLRVKSATVIQLIPVIASYLKKGQEYSIVFGDSKIGPPAWDIQWFADSLLMQPMPEIAPKKIEPNPLYKHSQSKMIMPTWLLWVAIAAAALILLTLTLKMTREVNKRAKE
jgi:hypothetical protein